MIVVVVAVVVFYLYARSESVGGYFGALGSAPVAGGADGSPQAQKAAAYSGTTTVGNSEQRIAHGLESALGAGIGAGACTYYGLGAAAPICAKAGAYLGPKAVQLGNFTTKKTVAFAEKTTAASVAVVNKATSIGTTLANKGASLGDRAYSDAGKLPGPFNVGAKAAILPVKVAADLGAKAAGAVQGAVGGINSGVKSAAHATSAAVNKVIGWL